MNEASNALIGMILLHMETRGESETFLLLQEELSRLRLLQRLRERQGMIPAELPSETAERNALVDEIRESARKRERLEENLALAVEALQFYANLDNYAEVDNRVVKVIGDRGARARAALKVIAVTNPDMGDV